MKKRMGVAEIKRNFSEVIIEVSVKGEHFIIEKNGKPMAAIVDVKSLEMVERFGTDKSGKGLLAAIGAWDDFDDLEKVIDRIYTNRTKTKNRSIRTLD